ncbi:MAG: DNA/RNA nuclease SfsA [Anaerolineae bacterium]
MKLPPDLVEGVFLRRRNRFAAEVEVAGQAALAHVPNSGRMAELLVPGAGVLLAPRRGPRRTPYDLLLVHHRGRLVGVDARLPPVLVAEAILSGNVPPFGPVECVQREVRLGTSRIDLLLTGSQGPCYVEAKSVNLVEQGVALFPDAPTTRGVRHLLALAGAAAAGLRAAVVFVIQRDDAAALRPHVEADWLFAETLRGVASVVQVLAYRCHVSRAEVSLAERVPVEI